MSTKRCIVQGCKGRVDVFGCLCDACYMSLYSGVIPKKTKSFLRCIPWMHDKLVEAKIEATKPDASIEVLRKILNKVEDDGE